VCACRCRLMRRACTGRWSGLGSGLGRVCRVAGISEKFDQAKLGSRGFGILDVACAPGAASCRAVPAWGDGYVGLWLDGVRVAGVSKKPSRPSLGLCGFGILDVACAPGAAGGRAVPAWGPGLRACATRGRSDPRDLLIMRNQRRRPSTSCCSGP